MKQRRSLRKLLTQAAVASIPTALFISNTATGALQLITWAGPTGTGGAGTWSNPAMWAGGVMPDNGTPSPTDTYHVFIDGGKAAASNVTFNLSLDVDHLTVSAGDQLHIGRATLTMAPNAVINNSGTILMQSTPMAPVTFDEIAGAGTITLTGGGTVNMAGSFSRILMNNGGRLINVNNTITGIGQLTTSTTHNFTNQAGGVVDASTSIVTSSNFLRMAFGTSSFNQGLMQARNQGVLQIRGTGVANRFDNTGGIVRSDSTVLPSRVELNSGTFTGGLFEVVGNGTLMLSSAYVSAATVNNSPTGVIHCTTGVSVLEGNINNPAGGRIFFDDLVAMQTSSLGTDNATTFTNNGDVYLRSNFSSMALGPGTFSTNGGGTFTFFGNGTIHMETQTCHIDGSIFVGPLTVSKIVNQNQLIRGRGSIGANGSFINKPGGTVDADIASGTLTIMPWISSTPVQSGTIANEGLMRASNGGTLHLQAGTFSNTGTILSNSSVTGSAVHFGKTGAGTFGLLDMTGGTITMTGAQAGTFVLAGNSTIRGGTFLNGTNGTLRIATGTQTLGGFVSSPAGSKIVVEDNATLQLQSTGTYNLTGSHVSLNAGTGSSVIRVPGPTFTLTAGTLAMSDNANNRIILPAPTDRLINGSAFIHGGGQFTAMDFTNAPLGRVIATTATPLTIDTTSVGAAGGFINQGTIGTSTGGRLVIPKGYQQTNTGRTVLDGGTLTVGGPTTLVDLAGTFSVSNGAVALLPGTLSVQSSSTILFNGGKLEIGTFNLGSSRALLGTGGGKTLKTASLSLSTGTIDLSDNKMLVDYAAAAPNPIANIRSLIVTGRSNGTWNARGITSSAARSSPQQTTSLGLLSGSEFLALPGGLTTFGGYPVDASSVLVRYTYYGDTDFNGLVNFDDYARIDGGFINARTGWLNGDFDYNGLINFDDYALIDRAFLAQSGTLERGMLYLNGDDRSTDGMDAPSLQVVMRHYARFGDAYGRSLTSGVPEPATSAAIVVTATALALRRRLGNRY